MSYANDDLTPLLIPPPHAGLGFRQGVVLTWNQETAENTIDVAGATLTDLPILNTNEALLLQAGDVVGIMTAGSSWFIMGRITIPSSAAAGTALDLPSFRTQSNYVTGSGSVNSGTYVDLPSSSGPTVDVTVGKSGRLKVTFGCLMTFPTLSGVAAGAFGAMSGAMSVAMSGVNVLAANNEWSLSFADQISISTGTYSRGATSFRASYTHPFEGLTPGLTTITAKYRTPHDVSCNFADRSLLAEAY